MKKGYGDRPTARARVAVAPTSQQVHTWFGLGALLALMLLLSACGGTQDVSNNLTPIAPNVPENDLAKVPAGLEEATVTIENGTFAERDLSLQVNQQTVLNVNNRDDVVYQLQIVPNLVIPTQIGAATTTQLELTTPNAGTFEAQILGQDGKVLATLPVNVETPDGNP
jgi:hypothetical protein